MLFNKISNKKIFITLALFMSLGVAGFVQAYSQKPLSNPTEAQVRSTMMLKKYMSHFGSLVAGMEILRYKEKTTDWEAIKITLEDMRDTLKKMQEADPEGRYREFTDVLSNNLKEVETWTQKKKRDQSYEAFDKLTGTCFACHAVHRPSDFLIPNPKNRKKNEKLSQNK